VTVPGHSYVDPNSGRERWVPAVRIYVGGGVNHASNREFQHHLALKERNPHLYKQLGSWEARSYYIQTGRLPPRDFAEDLQRLRAPSVGDHVMEAEETAGKDEVDEKAAAKAAAEIAAAEKKARARKAYLRKQKKEAAAKKKTKKKTKKK
jgi:hypothetical protein